MERTGNQRISKQKKANSMKHTKAQRRKIYLKAAEIVMSKDYDAGRAGKGLCYLVNRPSQHSHIDNFPELEMFTPKHIIHQNGVSRWWELDDKESRIICMLLCAEICKP